MGTVLRNFLKGELPQSWRELYCQRRVCPWLGPRGHGHVGRLQKACRPLLRPLLRGGHGGNRTGRVLPKSRVGAEPGRGSPRRLPLWIPLSLAWGCHGTCRDVPSPALPFSAESFTCVDPVPVSLPHSGSEGAVTWILLLDPRPVENMLHL